MHTTCLRSRWLKFAGVLVLIFGLPLLTIGRMTWAFGSPEQTTINGTQ